MTTGTENGDFLFGDDTFDFIDGKGGNDAIFGKGGTDLLLGGEGDDLLVGGLGSDSLNGGTGIDTANFADLAAGVDASLETGFANRTVNGILEQDLLIDVENLTGSNLDDSLDGNHLDNVLKGQAGKDFLSGWNGKDQLFGGNGDDLLVGGKGADLLDGGADSDFVAYSGSLAGVTLNLATGAGSGGDAQGDTLVSIENAIGSAFSDTITGNDLDNILMGNEGADILRGGDGNDVINGGKDGDVLRGGDGFDTLDYSSSGGVKIDLSANTASGGNAAGDDIGGFEAVIGTIHVDTLSGDGKANKLNGLDGADALNGRGGDDTLFGGIGDDTLKGGDGKDTLRGGIGRDTLVGGSDQDTFVFGIKDTGANAGTRDFIADFTSGVDKIDVSLFDANALADGFQAFNFIGGHTFNGIAGALRYKTEGGNTILEGDLDGNKIADFQIELKGMIDLALTDFIL